MKQTVRIIGGQYRGKKLHFPDIAGLRPTPSRVKETLFNWLMHDIREAHCLDAFAGSGSLGFEAYSRGAKSVVLVDSSSIVSTYLRQIAATFNSNQLQVVHARADDYLQKTLDRFDIVFLDPPFANNELPRCIEILGHSNVLKEGGLIYLESAEKQQLDPSLWREIKTKRAGQVHYHLYEKRAKEER